jgi:hypothetical protein
VPETEPGKLADHRVSLGLHPVLGMEPGSYADYSPAYLQATSALLLRLLKPFHKP